jgi:hypothetical protein
VLDVFKSRWNAEQPPCSNNHLEVQKEALIHKGTFFLPQEVTYVPRSSVPGEPRLFSLLLPLPPGPRPRPRSMLSFSSLPSSSCRLLAHRSRPSVLPCSLSHGCLLRYHRLTVHFILSYSTLARRAVLFSCPFIRARASCLLNVQFNVNVPVMLESSITSGAVRVT